MRDHDAIADVLDDAANLIERDGWTNYRSPRRKPAARCAFVAIEAAAVARGWDSKNAGGLYDPMFRFIGVRSNTAAFIWNDSFDEPQPVLDALRKCAKELRMLADSECAARSVSLPERPEGHNE